MTDSEKQDARAERSPEEKRHQLFLRQKQLLDVLLAHGAITRAQHDKSLGDLREKMGEKE